jgi:hypothetical protein
MLASFHSNHLLLGHELDVCIILFITSGLASSSSIYRFCINPYTMEHSASAPFICFKVLLSRPSGAADSSNMVW